MMSFKEMALSAPILQALQREGYENPTDIQQQAIPHILAGKDILGSARTGTGKTAAFALPILQKLAETPLPKGKRPLRALVISPTRELAAQIAACFVAYGRNMSLRVTTAFGGVNQNPQVAALQRGVDILVATPGRLLDLTWQGRINFSALEMFVIDEADLMLDMGFITDVKRIVELLPRNRQTLFFSATMPPEITSLADGILKDPLSIAVAPPCSTVDLIDQSLYHVAGGDKKFLLTFLMENPEFERVLIFTRTKASADKVAQTLEKHRIRVDSIHGNKTQSARRFALDNFKRGRIRALVATDIAARGIDVDHVTHVINYDLPNEPENYVHRIGRTARAGASGIAISFCDVSEKNYLFAIERLLKTKIRFEEGHPYEQPASLYVQKSSGNQGKQFKKRGGAPYGSKSFGGSSYGCGTRTERPGGYGQRTEGTGAYGKKTEVANKHANSTKTAESNTGVYSTQKTASATVSRTDSRPGGGTPKKGFNQSGKSGRNPFSDNQRPRRSATAPSGNAPQQHKPA